MLFPGQGLSQLADVARLGLRHSWEGRGFWPLLLGLKDNMQIGSAGGKNAVPLPQSESYHATPQLQPHFTFSPSPQPSLHVITAQACNLCTLRG